MFEYEDKIVLITGAGRGRGRMLAQALSKSGALIAVNDISPINLDPLVVIGTGRVKALVEDVAKKWGRNGSWTRWRGILGGSIS